MFQDARFFFGIFDFLIFRFVLGLLGFFSGLPRFARFLAFFGIFGFFSGSSRFFYGIVRILWIFLKNFWIFFFYI